MAMDKIVECVPNFSEGRRTEVIERILDCFRNVADVKLLDYSKDADHNRMVVTVVGQPNALAEAVLNAMHRASQLIDLTQHQGQHPRMGATDVVPFIPISNVTENEAIELSHYVGEQAYARYGIPVFLYEKSATAPNRENLADIRKGEFEGMADKMLLDEWHPDYGENHPHPTAGVTAVGMRMPLVAFNVNLDTSDVNIATKISKKVRFIGGGLRYCKAIGVELEQRNTAQVSMNLTNYTKTPIYTTLEMVRMEARRYGVKIIGTELIGLCPAQALIDCAKYYVQVDAEGKADLSAYTSKQLIDKAVEYLLIENFTERTVLENNF
ncbi:MAG: glutamate formimidoyltransferase [Clostridia bacterium]|nr:glutamate formimidoyltransferase [Clostridia bacterium]